MTSLTFNAVAMVERLTAYMRADHARGCEGRCYACTCEYDQEGDDLHGLSIDLIQSQAARIAELEGGLKPFATLAAAFSDRVVVEVCIPHPDNPSERIQPLRVAHLRQARSLLSEEGA